MSIVCLCFLGGLFYVILNTMKDFEITARCGKARAGTLVTPHGVIETPVFMPVGTQASIKGVPHDMLNCPVILSNAYYLYLKPGFEILKNFGGLHKFMNWNNAILTDSGGFQIFSLSSLFKIRKNGVEFRSKFDGSKHFLTPEEAVSFQFEIGSDMVMSLDRCMKYPSHRADINRAVDTTCSWAEKGLNASKRYETGQKLFAITQGGTFSDMRRECTERLMEHPFFGFAVGGLGVGEPLGLRQQHLAENLDMLPEDKPRYVMGMGPAPEIWDTVEMGADMMDCVLPTRNGRNAQAFTFSGKLNLRNNRFRNDPLPIDPSCGCAACSRYSRGYIHHLFNVREILAQTLTSLHNISFMIDLTLVIQNSIKNGTFPEEKKKFMKNWKGGN